MRDLGDEQFGALLDDHGVLRPDAVVRLERSSAYTVFAQRNDAVLDPNAIVSRASRFFQAKLELTVTKMYPSMPVERDAIRVMVSSDDGSAVGKRLCLGRPASDADYVAAEAAEHAQGSYGMALLARRCRMVWLVGRETEDDRAALTIAAVLASELLGPILTPDGDELFGVRTARLKLEGRKRPYR